MFSPFVAFDIFREGKRVLWDEFDHRVAGAEISRAFRIHDAAAPCTIDMALNQLSPPPDTIDLYGYHGAQEDVEGAVWRVEREGRVDFLAKYVRPSKVDGKYFSKFSGQPEIWFIDRPEAA